MDNYWTGIKVKQNQDIQYEQLVLEATQHAMQEDSLKDNNDVF